MSRLKKDVIYVSVFVFLHFHFFFFSVLVSVFGSIFPTKNYCYCNIAAILASASGSASQHSYMRALGIILEANLVE